ncbi:hypothetical protein SUGI_0906670 [Cryptomeria japonica]|nr:hypothetical protein SUGI_0906670 [Cryptomeria japonica]
MKFAGVTPDSATFAGILPACAKIGALDQGYAMHGFRKDALKLFELMEHSGIYPDHEETLERNNPPLVNHEESIFGPTEFYYMNFLER